MNNRKLYVALVSLTIVVILCVGMYCISKNNQVVDFDISVVKENSDELNKAIAESCEENLEYNECKLDELRTEKEIINQGQPVPTTQTMDASSHTALHSDNSFAKITIKTSKMTGTYKVMPDVYEKTLRNNIGWLPSSSLPGEEGLCILLGHRDTDFKILQYVDKGDILNINMENLNISYLVTKIQVVNSDGELRFEAFGRSNLLLVTCYPFRHTCHAPKKYVVYAKVSAKRATNKIAQ